MKKIILVVCTIMLLGCALVGCGFKDVENTAKDVGNKIVEVYDNCAEAVSNYVDGVIDNGIKIHYENYHNSEIVEVPIEQTTVSDEFNEELAYNSKTNEY